MKEIIYINGFPKSGNTWLTRLIAEALESPSGSGFTFSSDIKESATEGLDRNGNYKVLKAHYIYELLPKEFKESKIIVPIRDVRDVLVSQYYHGYTTLERFPISRKLAQKFSFFEFLYDFHKMKEDKINLELAPNIFHHIKKYYARCDFEKVITNNSNLWSNIKLHNDSFLPTNWSTFNKKWYDEMLIKDNIVFVKYEDLLEDTYSTLVGAFKKLNILDYSEEQVLKAIDNQSFSKKKQAFENREIDAHLGAKYNANFMRKGQSGDYKNYLQPSLEQKILSDHYEVLNTFGYIK